MAEEAMLKLWAKEKTFEKSLKLRERAPHFSFYDGPPFANGLPHYGHVVPSTIKDAIARYKTMRGYYVPRVAGWDTHGLPVEYDVEKQLGLSGKKQILEMGVDKFNQACRDSVFRYKGEFENFIRRLGRWVDLDNAYATLDDSYIESVWWVFAEIYKKGLVYKGFRSMPYCPRCATPLSNFELNQGYQDDVEDPSVFATFPLKDNPKIKLLAWTTTPWTLPANAALAIDAKADYAYAELKADGSQLVLAKKRLDLLDLRKSEYKVLKTLKGKQLAGLKYEPLYPLPKNHKFTPEQLDKVWRIYTDESVSLEDGTGILHVAPRYGETDLALGLKEKLPLLESVDSNGLMVEPKSVAGQFFKKADEHIIAELTKTGRIFAAESGFKHTYPFCWRCDTPLMYFATPNWLIKVTAIRDELVKNNQKINWVPKHIRDGRFGNWLADARDWGISRNRFWGSPLPVWLCDKEHVTVVGSLEELKARAVSWPKELDLHRPGIDKIKLKCDECGEPAQRVEEVFDCWFESGSMPYASVHYPFENQEEFKKGFPAEFISEGLDQTRGWFYTLHVLGTALFNCETYKNVVCHGIVVAGDGKKLSKRLKNYPPLDEVFNTYGSDILRFFMLNSPVVVGEEVRFSADHLRDTQRNVFMTLQNSFGFFKTYADVDKWAPKSLEEPKADNVLDKWILARLNQTISEVTAGADKYQVNKATRPIVGLLEDLSNWYIRRSRRRFWKSENDKDKNQAYSTLHYVLVRICQLMAPWAPFISDQLWRQLTKDTKASKSVHLSDWPSFAKATEGKPSVNKPDNASTELLDNMQKVRDFVINDGLSQRAAAGIKVRQPLASVSVNLDLSDREEFEQIIAEELNVKKVRWVKSGKRVKVDTKLTIELKSEGVMRELVRHVQNARKNAGLNVDDRIKLRLETDDGAILDAIEQFKDTIFTEALATSELDGEGDHTETVKVEGKELNIGLSKI